MSRVLLLCLFAGISFSVFAQTTDANYVLTKQYKQGMTDPNASTSVSQANTIIQYIDGLGRPYQTVQYQNSPSKKDVIVPNVYDALGREAIKYLPYSSGNNLGQFRGSAVSDLSSFYNGSTPQIPSSSRYYSQNLFEESSLGRPTGQWMLGFVDKGQKVSYEVNAANEVKRYDVSSSNTLQENGYYAAGTLHKVANTNENNKVSYEYKDKAGNVLLRKNPEGTQTYYVYNDLQQLVFVLQPNFQGEGNIDKFAFQYKYNANGLVSDKKIPGGGWVKFEYNADLLLEKTTDAKNNLVKTEYDDQRRPVRTRNGDNAVLTETYYDHYGWGVPGELGYGSEIGLPGGAITNAKGYVTGTKIALLGTDGKPNGTYLVSVIYYDDKYRVIQTARKLPSELGDRERVSLQVDFAGKILKQRTTHFYAGSASFWVEKTFDYDHADRITGTRYSFSDRTQEVYTSKVFYNEVGQIVGKYLHSPDNGNNFRQQLDQSFNIQGWLYNVTGYRKNSGQTLENFGIKLRYFDGFSNDNPTGLYNGNIAQMSWKTPTPGGSTRQGGYNFSYDDLDRLRDATGQTNVYGGFQEQLTYDANGNIKTLLRKQDGNIIDNLNYEIYDGNRLKQVNDSGNKGEGFKDNSGGNDYEYDENGNLKQDNNRGISSISYNYLNLPTQIAINGKTLTYTYDASGAKHAYSDGTRLIRYEGSFEYSGQTTNKPSRISFEEGQIVYENGSWSYQYYLRDHQGNVRSVLKEDGTILQETEYFPFGMAVTKTPASTTDSYEKNRYLYNQKELQPETGFLDYGARQYDPTVGRWGVVDGLAEKFEFCSPFNYALNSPILYVDVDGNESNSTHISKFGEVLAVYDDDDLGVYIHADAETKEDVDKSRKREKSRSGGGKKVGETEFWDEFVTPGSTNHEDGRIVLGSDWKDLVEWGYGRSVNQDFLITYKESKLYGALDLKNNKKWAPYGPMTGRLLNGRYATARSAGNYLAGIVGVTGTIQGQHISAETYMKLAGAYQVGKFSTLNAMKILLFGTSFGKSPYFGEEPYSGRRILQGLKEGTGRLKREK